ncbi:uncharacterized protein VTP21DRAFT_851 [Calcarisporiella thermophila]|uniref:uncharacterized protein n=1 Tax=Calcarisporiella thermophila TaxID=911321 RepID=UPI0037434CD2
MRGLIQKLRHHVNRLDHYTRPVSSLKDTPLALNRAVRPIHEEYGRVVANLQSKPFLTLNTYNRMLEYHGLANRLTPREFPMEKAERILVAMQAQGVQPDYHTYLHLMRGYARTREFDSPRENKRLDKALAVFYRMQSSGVPLVDQRPFQALFEACLPHTITFNSDYFLINRKRRHNLQQPPWVDPRIFDIERIMIEAGIPHDRVTLKTFLTCLGLSGLYVSMWSRWRGLYYAGIRRDEGLYQRVLALASLDPEASQYALSVVLNSMRRESPPVQMSVLLYETLLDCANTAQDENHARSIAKEIRENSEFAKNDRLQSAIAETFLSIHGLESEGLALCDQLLNAGCISTIRSSLWVAFADFFARKEPALVEDIFQRFVLWRNKSLAEKQKKTRETSVTLPNSTSQFPTGPYVAVDLEMIHLYLRRLLDSQNLGLATEALKAFADQFSPEQSIYLRRQMLQDYVEMARRQERKEDALWALNHLGDRVLGSNSKYRHWTRFTKWKLGEAASW